MRNLDRGPHWLTTIFMSALAQSKALARNRGRAQWCWLASIVAAGVSYPAIGAAQSQCPTPSHRLTRTDYALMATSSTLLAADWLLSVDAARRGGHNQETNVLLGPHPSVGRHNTYTALTVIGNLSVARITKPSLRRTVWVAVSAVEARTVLHMFSLGYHINFRI